MNLKKGNLFRRFTLGGQNLQFVTVLTLENVL